MLDRFGHRVSVGWPAHHILWIEAAMTLPHAERIDAFNEIGEMTGRGYAAVYHQSTEILRRREAAKRRADLAALSRPHQSGATGSVQP